MTAKKRKLGGEEIDFIRDMIFGYKMSTNKDDKKFAKLITNLLGEIRRARSNLWHCDNLMSQLDHLSDDQEVKDLVAAARHKMRVAR